MHLKALLEDYISDFCFELHNIMYCESEESVEVPKVIDRDASAKLNKEDPD